MVESTVKDKVLKALEEMPQDVTFEAIMERLYFLLRATVEKLLGTNPDTVPTSEFPLNKSTLQNAINMNST